MKLIAKTILWLIVIGVTILVFCSVAGCTQVIIEKDRLQINTFLMTTGFGSFYYDPNGISEVDKYMAIPSDVELSYDPLTKTVKFKTKANKQ